jgi:hypothetical protein
MDQTDSFDDVRAGLPDVSPDVSVFWKPLRLLLQEGKPVGPVTVLFHDAGDDRLLPDVSIAKTTGTPSAVSTLRIGRRYRRLVVMATNVRGRSFEFMPES